MPVIIISALFSLGIMMGIYFAYRRQWFRGLSTLMLGGALLVGCVFSPMLVLHALFLIPVLWLCRWRQWSATALLALMVLAMGASYSLPIYLAVQQLAEYQRLRAEYPFESMAERLPAPKSTAVNALSKDSEEHLNQLQKAMEAESNGFRIYMLQQLHQETLQSFINSPGFGVGRRIRPTEWTLKVNLDRDGTAIPQPALPSYTTLSEVDLLEPKGLNRDPLRELHLASVVSFANPRGFGWIISRQKVAGFQSHQFNMVPKAKQWKVQTLELVGLLMHEAPVVYVSEALPIMEKERNSPTRPLNIFETAALKRLQEGEDLYVREMKDRIRMLGAVRSAEECVRCHGGQRGDLLGAFSYSLQRQP